MNYEIREMQQEDGRSVLDIFRQGIEGGNATFETDVPTWEDWDQKHLKAGRFVMVNDNEEVVGWCALTHISDRDCFSGVAEVSIYLDYRFQGKGLGSVLLRKLVLDSEENGYWMLQSGIFPENIASIKTHEKFGFRTVGTREKIGQMNGTWRDIVLMERRSRVVAPTLN